MHKTLVILAAGMASRYGGGKQVDGMGPHGETLMEYSIHDARKAGFDKVVFIIKRCSEQVFREIVGKRIGGDVEICYACQEYDSLPGGFVPPEGRLKPYGTAHAVLSARNFISEPFAVINADDYYGPAAYRAASACLDQIAGQTGCGAMIGYKLRNTVSDNGHVTRGVCETDHHGRLMRITETYQIIPFADGTIRTTKDDEAGRILDPDASVSMNFWCFAPQVFDQAERELTAFLQDEANAASLTAEFTLPEMVDCLMQRGELTIDVLATSAVWFGVTYREDKPSVMAELQRLHDEKVYPEKL